VSDVRTEPETPELTPVQQYLGSIHRTRRVYAISIAVGALVLIVGSIVFLQRGEGAHVTLHTVPDPPAAVDVLTPATSVAQAWTSSDRSAIGQPYWGGTVVTFDDHTVRGRDGQSGAETWSYTRTDRSVCTATQQRGITVAVYRNKGNCDELTGLDSQTGERKWTRTTDKDGFPVDGTPAFQATGYTLLMTTSSVIYAIDPVSGLDRWQWKGIDCTIQSAVVGSNGALIRQNCANPDCPAKADGSPVLCGPGQQLLLRDANAGHSDDDKDKANPDRVKWDLLNSTLVPVAADAQILAADPGTGELVALNTDNGKESRRIPLKDGVGPTFERADAGGSAGGELVRTNGRTYAVVSGAVSWDAPTAALPTVSAADDDAADLKTGILLVPGTSGADLLDPQTGKVTRTVAGASFPDPSAVAYPFGAGVLVAGTTTTMFR